MSSSFGRYRFQIREISDKRECFFGGGRGEGILRILEVIFL